jgi:hypothetical protein
MTPERFSDGLPRRFESDAGPSAEVRARVAAMVEGTPSIAVPIGRRLAVATFVLPSAVVGVLAGHYAVSRGGLLRAGLAALPVGHLIFDLLVLPAVTVGATVVAARPGRRGLGSPGAALLVTSVAVAPLYAAMTLLWPLQSDAPEAVAAVARLHPVGLPCLIVAVAIGVLALGALTWALGHAVPVAARARGAALGAASGVWAGSALVVHCPGSEPVHVLVGHVAPVVLFTALGALVVPRFLRT